MYEALLRREQGDPIRVALVGAGTFGQMFAAQARRTPGMHLAAIADLEPAAAARRLRESGWDAERFSATSIDQALRSRSTWLTDDSLRVVADERIDVVVEATGDPVAGVRHALHAIDHGRHVVMVNVEADALVGPVLAQRAAAAGTVYSLAYGDQPALICEMVDWARTSGFEVVAAGKGTKYLPAYRSSTPDTVWSHYGMDADRARHAGFNSQMFNSFLDGTKSAIEMTAVANATGLGAPVAGLRFPSGGVSDLASLWSSHREAGGRDVGGVVEVISSLRRDGTEISDNLRWGVFVVFATDDDYVAARLADYGVRQDASGRVAALYRPVHLIGLELGISVASVAIRREPTGAPGEFRADAVAVAKRDLRPGERLDGEGGFTVRGEIRPAAVAVAGDMLPIGLARHVDMVRCVGAGEPLRWSDVAIDDQEEVAVLRRSMERSPPLRAP